jgi:hypothetical protein
MFQAKAVDKIKTHFVFNNFLSKILAVYENMWKIVIDPDRPQMTI